MPTGAGPVPRIVNGRRSRHPPHRRVPANTLSAPDMAQNPKFGNSETLISATIYFPTVFSRLACRMPRGKLAVPRVLMPGPAKALALAGRGYGGPLRRPKLSFFPVGVSTEANGGDALRGMSVMGRFEFMWHLRRSGKHRRRKTHVSLGPLYT